MSTLAQRLVNGGPKVEIDHLNLHLRLVDFLTPHQGSTVEQARQIAEKFHFQADPISAIMTQMRAGVLDWDTVLNTALPVALPMWMEWEDDRGDVRFGHLIAQDSKPQRLLFFGVAGGIPDYGRTTLLYVARTPLMPFGMNKQNLEVFYINRSFYKGESKTEAIELIRGLTADAIRAMFILCTPRVADTEPMLAPRAVRRRQLREHPNKPLIEFKTVKMRIGVAPTHGAPTYDPDGTHEVIHRRLHKVIGHYRVYTKEREVPKVAFVPEHWRGDPELGIVLHNREVQKK